MDPLEAIKATFFQECEELLADLETGLLAMEGGDSDPETVNAVFRAVHSVKGGAGAFGLEGLVRFAHVFETTLDGVRNGSLDPEPGLVAVMLRAADRLADHVSAAKAGTALAEAGDEPLVAALQTFCGEAASAGHDEAEPDFDFAPMAVSLGGDESSFTPMPVSDLGVLDVAEPVAAPAADGGWIIEFRPHPNLYRNANDALYLIRELARLGPVEAVLHDEAVPNLDAFDPAASYLGWTLLLDAAVSEDQVRGVFEFVDGDCDLTLRAVGSLSRPEETDAADEERAEAVAPVGEIAAEAPSEADPAILGADPSMPSLESLLAMAHGLAEETAPAGSGDAEVSDGEAGHDAPPSAPIPTSATVARAEPRERSAPGAASAAAPPFPAGGEALVQTTIRVDLERVDRLIDLVGELVINQAMLAQQVHEAGIVRSGNIALGLDDLEQLTREIQDSVMAIRAQPVKSVFQRMPRLVREVAGMTGKVVRLVTEGEATEVDKTVIERLSDPLTHMIRNAIDHGLEGPDAREAAGKPREGVIRLSAQHRSGRIVIEVADDGRGIDRARVKAIAVERGLIEADATLTDEEVDNLIFAPGFSTASEVSDISGRGVGMDVVKRSIQALGGRITITSVPGAGSTFSLSLPLTLAVLDGMVVTVGAQTLVVPITVIVETLRPKAADIRGLGPQGAVLAVRGSHVPLIDVGEALGFAPDPEGGAGVTLLVESELGGLAALRVDAILGQRQVVIKSLEQNYDQVLGIGAATILGDGRVALILDVDAVIALRRQTSARPLPLAQAS